MRKTYSFFGCGWSMENAIRQELNDRKMDVNDEFIESNIIECLEVL